MAHLLIADDEEQIRTLIRKYAEFGGHTVEEAADGIAAVTKAREKSFDAVILDLMMPELDGFSVCREIRKDSSVPIIMLSARGEEYDKINGFEAGADDYVVKPFSPRELLFYMIRNRNIALSREKLISDVWGYEFFGGDRTLDTHVKLLRKKLGKYSEHIITLRGVGYRFDA